MPGPVRLAPVSRLAPGSPLVLGQFTLAGTPGIRLPA
jgi:hypothetical protein